MVFATVHHIHSFVCVRRQDTHISRHLSGAPYVSFLSAQTGDVTTVSINCCSPFSMYEWMVHDQHIFTCWNIPRCPGLHRLQFLLKWRHLELTFHHIEKPVDTDGQVCFVDLGKHCLVHQFRGHCGCNKFKQTSCYEQSE